VFHKMWKVGVTDWTTPWSCNIGMFRYENAVGNASLLLAEENREYE